MKVCSVVSKILSVIITAGVIGGCTHYYNAETGEKNTSPETANDVTASETTKSADTAETNANFVSENAVTEAEVIKSDNTGYELYLSGYSKIPTGSNVQIHGEVIVLNNSIMLKVYENGSEPGEDESRYGSAIIVNTPDVDRFKSEGMNEGDIINVQGKWLGAIEGVRHVDAAYEIDADIVYVETEGKPWSLYDETEYKLTFTAAYDQGYANGFNSGATIPRQQQAGGSGL